MSLVGILALVRWLGLAGAFWGYPLSAIVLFVAFLWYAKRAIGKEKLFSWGIYWPELRKLFKFCGVVLATTAAGYGAQLIVRSRVIAQLGVVDNGILQVPLALSAYFAPFVTNGLHGRLHPHASVHGHGDVAITELSSALRLATVVTTAYGVCLLVMPELFVRFAFTPAFLPSIRLMRHRQRYQYIGQAPGRE